MLADRGTSAFSLGAGETRLEIGGKGGVACGPQCAIISYTRENSRN